MVERCAWARSDLLAEYHDREWGLPVHDDRILFEFLVLDGFQAGLSWELVLRKRPALRRALADFEPARLALFGPAEAERLAREPGLIRNRPKIEAAISNARVVLALQEEFGSFDAFVWRFVGGRPLVNAWSDWPQVPAESEQSRALSRELKRRGFKFVGPRICYAFMQSAGLVNDHLLGCFRRAELLGRL